MREFYENALELNRSGTAHVIVTLGEVRGEAPNDPGCKMIVVESGLHYGTVGGGKVEKRAIEHAQAFLRETQPAAAAQVVTWNLQKDIGMTCGGEVTYLFERHDPQCWEIAIFGAGHVAQALVRALLPLPCALTVIDSRAEWLARLPQAAQLRNVHAETPASIVPSLSRDTFFVVMTQGHASDVPVLEAILRLPQIRYVGAIGSDIKAKRLKAELRERGIPDVALEQLRCPIGLPLGDNNPAEIAVSVAAQLLQVRGHR